jgi:hypothetical protein
VVDIFVPPLTPFDVGVDGDGDEDSGEFSWRHNHQRICE